ncbi:uncharacterized protein PGTG_06106 [Puccinia graminis f. sp. tritici CRL 75-36-700-3]|uniref:Uncharacterized protein n=1 Tax=Puccinia graminis f. sp. tritici (strain CRL 75-36-700-3 / race SCCL) TaxID=418459 RepID=E3K5N2_PUCGT|nr:uncharacterized protein PGTG_06106 [Puccinia graminis f. sp. tritici CRL 75-36-700-3]EFP79785.1 hypothetical protein PGTG_06106 [Puccinia graminis f. sp. tritici CRL 75-36-700-3]
MTGLQRVSCDSAVKKDEPDKSKLQYSEEHTKCGSGKTLATHEIGDSELGEIDICSREEDIHHLGSANKTQPDIGIGHHALFRRRRRGGEKEIRDRAYPAKHASTLIAVVGTRCIIKGIHTTYQPPLARWDKGSDWFRKSVTSLGHPDLPAAGSPVEP